MPRRALTTIAASLLLALTPGAAFAQGAGDEQYQDPLTAPSTPKQPKKKASPTAPATTTAPAATSAPTATSAPAATSTQAAPAQELPRTGAPAGLIGLAGATLILSGAALRRRTITQ
jgi:LPXTG-motif cell wall-anchored protein